MVVEEVDVVLAPESCFFLLGGLEGVGEPLPTATVLDSRGPIAVGPVGVGPAAVGPAAVGPAAVGPSFTAVDGLFGVSVVTCFPLVR